MPVATSRSGALTNGSVSSSEGTALSKMRTGIEPQVSGPMKEAMAERPGCRYRSNLCTSLGVFPAWEKSYTDELAFGTGTRITLIAISPTGLMTIRRGPHWSINSFFDLIGTGCSELRWMLKLHDVLLCSCRRRENAARGQELLFCKDRGTPRRWIFTLVPGFTPPTSASRTILVAVRL